MPRGWACKRRASRGRGNEAEGPLRLQPLPQELRSLAWVAAPTLAKALASFWCVGCPS